jgi:hypothetical protein
MPKYSRSAGPKEDLLLSPWTTPKAKQPKKHPLALPERKTQIAQTKPSYTPFPAYPDLHQVRRQPEAPVETVREQTKKTPQMETSKAPASGEMSYKAPPEAPQATRGAVTSSIEPTTGQQISNVISGSEAIRRASSEAQRIKLERELWGIHR